MQATNISGSGSFDCRSFNLGNFQLSFDNSGKMRAVKDLKSGRRLAFAEEGIWPFDAKIDFDDPPCPTNFGIRGIQKTGVQDYSGIWLSESKHEVDIKAGFDYDGDRLEVSYQLRDCLFSLAFETGENGLMRMNISLDYSGSVSAYLRALKIVYPRLDLNVPGSFYYIADPQLFPNQLRRTGDKTTSGPIGKGEPRNEPWSYRLDALFLKGSRNKPDFMLYAHSYLKEGVGYSYSEADGGVDFSLFFSAFAALHKTRHIHCGPVFIRSGAVSWDDAWTAVEKLKLDAGIKASQSPDWIKGSAIYQVHPYIWDFGGFKSLGEQLERIKNMGFDILYLPPLHPSRSYCQRSITHILDSYGSREDFLALNDKAKKLGMKIIVDTVPHSMLPGSDICRKHPEWIARDETSSEMGWSTSNWQMDVTNEGWQNHYVESCVEWALSDRFDGFRVDAMICFPPDWSGSGNYLWPGRKSWGSVEMMQRLHTAMREADPDSLVISEVCMLGCDAYYQHHIWSSGFHRALRRMECCADYRQWKQFIRNVKTFIGKRKFCEPAGGVAVLSLRNHDQVPALGREFLNSDRSVMALSCFLEGLPLLSMSTERGAEKMIRCILSLRRKYADFVNAGREVFNIETPDSLPVLGFSRMLEGRALSLVINLSGRRLSGKGKLKLAEDVISLPIELAPYDFNIYLTEGGETILADKGFEEEDERTGALYAKVKTSIEREPLGEVCFEDLTLKAVYPERWEWDPTLFSCCNYNDEGWVQAVSPSFETFGEEHTGFEVRPIWMPGDTPLEWWTDLSAGKSKGHFRQLVEIDGDIRYATAEIMAEDSFDLYINGAYIVSGGIKDNRFWYPEKACCVDKVDLSGVLKPGKNCLGYIIKHIGSSRGLAARITVSYKDGREIVFRTDRGCKSGPENAYSLNKPNLHLAAGSRYSDLLLPAGKGQNTLSESMPVTLALEDNGLFRLVIDSRCESLPSKLLAKVSFRVRNIGSWIACRKDTWINSYMEGELLRWRDAVNFCSFEPMPEFDGNELKADMTKPLLLLTDKGYLALGFPPGEKETNLLLVADGGDIICTLIKRFPPAFGFLANFSFMLKFKER
jgi:hypothetical protein